MGAIRGNDLLLVNLAKVNPTMPIKYSTREVREEFYSTADEAWDAAKISIAGINWGTWYNSWTDIHQRGVTGDIGHNIMGYSAVIKLYKYRLTFNLVGLNASRAYLIGTFDLFQATGVTNVWAMGAIHCITTGIKIQVKEDKATNFGDVTSYFGTEAVFEFHDIYNYEMLDNLKPSGVDERKDYNIKSNTTGIQIAYEV